MTRTKSIQLICLPFAGGNKFSYRQLAQSCPSFINAVTLEYPGRGQRAGEPLETDIMRLVDDIYRQLKDLSPTYAIYGHSMGGLIAFLLARKLIKNNDQVPLHLFISGASAPSARSRNEKEKHLLDTEEFIEELKRLDGCPAEILEDKELLNYLVPILRADFKACETYQYEISEPLNIPMTVMTGDCEDMDLEDINRWQNESNHQVDYKTMKGNHFFILQNTVEIMEIISKKTFDSWTCQV